MKTTNEKNTEVSQSANNFLNFAALKLTRTNVAKILVIGIFAAFAFFRFGGLTHSQTSRGSDGPANQGNPVKAQTGDKKSGQQVFRFETFGTEGFWTDAVRTPQGMVAAKVTPLQALQLGLSVDVDALDDATKKAVAADLKKDPTGKTSKLFNDPMTTVRLVNANAVIGLPIKDSNGDGKFDALNGDKVGVSCALCHSVTDGSVLNLPNGGSIGKRVDNLTNHNLNVGKILATAANSRALYPTLQLSLTANKGKTLGRAPTGLTEKSSEAEVDAYLSNPNYYPIGMFDDTFDGNGDPMHITPFFRQDLAAPFGSDGTIARLDNFNNLVFTALFDQTNLTTPGGRAFAKKLAGAAGEEVVDDYIKILKETGVTNYPYVKANEHPQPGSEDAPLGVRVDNQKLLDLNAYVVELNAPKGERGDKKSIERGRELFRTQGCTVCHNVDQSKSVPAVIIPMKTIFPGDNPVMLAQRMPPLNPIIDTPGVFFDDKMAVLNATLRGDIRGTAMPLLFELFRKPVFLHDNSVPSLDALFDPARGANAPHPFFITDMKQRTDIITFLRSLDDNSK
jgi:cytochrome c2